MFWSICCVAVVALPCPALEVHVSPRGKDGGKGTKDAPYASLTAARDAVRRVAGKEAVTVLVGDGIYYLPETLVFGPEDSGTAAHPVRWRAMNEGKAVISGGMKLELAWKPYRDGIMQAATPPGLAVDQVFVNGARQRMARYPNYDAKATTKAFQGYAADAFSVARAQRWANPAGGYIHAMHAAHWGGYHYRITGKDAKGAVTYEGGWQNNRQMGMHKDQRMVENIFEELDAPGEWYHDARANTLYYQPEAGVPMDRAVVEVVRLNHLVEFTGSMAKPVRHIRMEGLVFRHAARTFMETKEPLLRSDWTIYRGGMVRLEGTEHVALLDCEFDQPGGNAVFFSNYNRHGKVKGCHIHDAGASGVCFVGDPVAVRDPLFEYNQKNDLAKIDLTPGPKSENYPADCAVEDSLIRGIGRVERQPAGVQISMSARIAVRDCSIYDCARSGINISEGTWGGHLIERCDVFKTVQETGDHGSFNSWGRDRFWHPNPAVTNEAVKANPKLPLLDARETTVIRDSRWRCDHGWDIDLDDGSGNYEIYNNLMLRGGLKFREGYHRKAYNNVIINNGFHPHVWYENADSSFERNIAMGPHRGTRNAAGWTAAIDRNFYTSEAYLADNRAMGADKNSLAGDPKFLAPARGDFRVAADSPALRTGFRNFPMDRFGVKKPALKSLAATPEIPRLATIAPKSPLDIADARPWLGATIHSIRGEEFSAFGVTREAGGVQLTDVPHGAYALDCGLRKDDLLQAIDGQPIRNSQDLAAAMKKIQPGAKVNVRFIRDQQAVEREMVLLP